VEGGLRGEHRSVERRASWREVFVERNSPKRGERHGDRASRAPSRDSFVSRKWDQPMPRDGGPISDLFMLLRDEIRHNQRELTLAQGELMSA
jgi:hypothetical protein